jgi:acyl carrier protein
LRQTVRFSAALTHLFSNPENILLEVGPGQTLSNLSRQNPARPPAQIVLASLPHAKAEQDDLAKAFTALGQLWVSGVNVDWPKLYPDKPQHVPLPTYPFEHKNYFVESAKPPALNGKISVANALAQAAPLERETVGSELKTAPERGGMQSVLRRLLAAMSGLKPEQLPANASFIELGFDSLFLTQFSQAIEKTFGVHISFGQILEKYSTLELLSARLAERAPVTKEALNGLKDKLDPLLVNGSPANQNGAEQLVSNAAPTLPLTEGQKEIWFSSQVSNEAGAAFNLSQAFNLRGPLKEAALRQALQTLVERHDALRATFDADGEKQAVTPAIKLNLSLSDWTNLPEAERQTRLDNLLCEERVQSFDLLKGPLFRARLIRTEAETHVLLWSVHHLSCDGGSNLILQKELAELYNAYAGGTASGLPPTPSYSEYIRQQTAPDPQRASDEAYWLGQYSPPPAPLELPVDLPRPATTYRGAFPNALTSVVLGENLLRQFNQFSARSRGTLFTTLLAVYSVLLTKLSGQTDLAIGVPVALRSTENSENLVGSCVNFMPLRLRSTDLLLPDGLTFNQYLGYVRRIFFDGFDHHKYSYGSIVQQLKLPRDWRRPPLVSATFNLQRRHEMPSWNGLVVKQIPNRRPFTFFDLSLDVGEIPNGLLVECSYRADLFEPATIARWLQHFQNLAAAVVANPDRPLSEFEVAEPSHTAQAGRTDLGSPQGPRPPEGPVAGPETAISPIEERLAQIWREVIGLKEVGIHDNFFDLGGHSVLVTQILTRVRSTFQVHLTLRSVFEAPTIHQLAQVIEQQLLADLDTMTDDKSQQLSERAALALKG